MAIETLYPAIRPSLDLNFAGSKALDPRITFSRASAATYYDGKTVAKAEENLFTNSDGPLQTVINGAVYNVDGTISFSAPANASYKVASKLIEAGTQFTASVLLSGVGVIRFGALNGAGANIGSYAQISLTSTPTKYSFSIFNTASGSNCGFQVLGASDGSAATVKIEKYQFEIRDQATAYTPTTTQPITNYIPVLQTAPAGVPRFDHNPVTGESLGLLVEEQRTNLATYSEQFDNNSWGKVDASVATNSFVAPDGSLSADVVTVLTSGGYISKTAVVAATSGQTYTISVFTNTLDRKLTFGGATPNYLNASYSSTPIGNGWYRHTGTVTLNADGPVQLVLNKGAGGAGASFAAWGAQAELGAFPTSYIKTEASQVTRATDSAQITGINFSSWYRQDEGTLFAESFGRNQNSTPWVAAVYSDLQNYLGIIDNYQSNATNIAVMASGVSQAFIAIPTNKSDFRKVSMSYAFNNVSASGKGSTAVSDTSASIPTLTGMSIGSFMGSTVPIGGHIKRISYYPKRLSDAQLQALTA